MLNLAGEAVLTQKTEKPATSLVPRQILPGLDGLRALAAGIVLIGHVYQISGIHRFTTGTAYPLFILAAKTMVNLFFVISGFIITYLLYGEKLKTGNINLVHFYKKRALRIWPLYYFLFLCVCIIDKCTPIYQLYESFNGTGVIAISFFLVNLNHALFIAPLLVLPHYWSLSVEEQFYIFWPFLFRNFNAMKLCISVIVIIFLLRNGAAFLSSRGVSPVFTGLNNYLFVSSFGSMAIGALAGIGFKDKWRFFRKLGSNTVWIILWTIVLALLISRVYVPYIQAEMQAVVFAAIILSAIYRKATFLDLPAFRKIGKVSFGIYMYHWPLIPIIIFAFQYFDAGKFVSIWYGIPFVVLCFSLTYVVSLLSYRFLEKPFLKMK